MWSRFAIVSMIVLSMSAPASWAQLNWLDDVSVAQAAAKEAQKDVLVYVADDRPASRQLEKDVLADEDVVAAVDKLFVAVKLDIAGDDALVKTFKSDYGLKQAPAVFLTDAAGIPYGRINEVVEDVHIFHKRFSFEWRHKPLLDIGGTWLDNYETGKAKAAAQGKHLLMLFTGSDWCPACIMMERNIFGKPAFEETIGKDFVLVKFDFPRRKTLPLAVQQQNDKMQDLFAEKHKFRGYPTVYLAYPDGNPYAQVGPVNMEPKAYAEMLIKGRQEELKKKADSAS